MPELSGETRVLLVEDYDQNAFLFERMLCEESGAAQITRARRAYSV